MKKLATVVAFVSSAAIAAPAFACPNMDHDEAPKTTTAEKDKKAPDTAKKAPDAAPKSDAKPADTAKSKDASKKPDKVSSN